MCYCTSGIWHVSDADCILPATPAAATPKLHASKLMLSTASMRVQRYVMCVLLIYWHFWIHSSEIDVITVMQKLGWNGTVVFGERMRINGWKDVLIVEWRQANDSTEGDSKCSCNVKPKRWSGGDYSFTIYITLLRLSWNNGRKLPFCCSCLWWWCGLFLTVGLDECTYCRLCQVSTRMSDIQGLDLRSHRLVI